MKTIEEIIAAGEADWKRESGCVRYSSERDAYLVRAAAAACAEDVRKWGAEADGPTQILIEGIATRLESAARENR
jgi:hypothetical protein